MDDRNKNLDVLFIIPPVLRFMARSSDSFPLGPGYIVSYLKDHDINSGIYNADIHQKRQDLFRKACRFIERKFFPFSYNVEYARKWPDYYRHVNDVDNSIWNEVREVLRKLEPGIIGIGSKVVDIPSTIILTRIVKETLPSAKVVIGGPSAITCPEYLMENSQVDYLVNGEGEETMLELATCIINNNARVREIKGITYRDGTGKIVTNPPRPLIQDLDDIPFPDRRSMFVVDNGELRYINVSSDVLTSRGCPFGCRFCAAYEAWGTKRPRFRSIENIVRELKYLKTNFDQDNFIFWDDLFTVDRERTIQLCQKIIEEKLDIRWVCLVRIDLLDIELLEIMKKAGCYEIQIGIESGNDRILKYIRKGIDLLTIREQIKIIKQSGIDWRIFLIIGFPTETREEIMDTLDLISEIDPTYVDLSMFCPYPGTGFFFDLQKKGLLGKDLMRSDMWYPYVTYTGTMSNEEFEKIAFKALKYVDDFNNGSLKGKVSFSSIL